MLFPFLSFLTIVNFSLFFLRLDGFEMFVSQIPSSAPALGQAPIDWPIDWTLRYIVLLHSRRRNVRVWDFVEILSLNGIGIVTICSFNPSCGKNSNLLKIDNFNLGVPTHPLLSSPVAADNFVLRNLYSLQLQIVTENCLILQ